MNFTLLGLSVFKSYSVSPYFQLAPTTYGKRLAFRNLVFNQIAGKFLNSRSLKTSVSIGKSSFSKFDNGVIRLSQTYLYEEDNETFFRNGTGLLSVNDCYFRYINCEKDENSHVIYARANLSVTDCFFYSIYCEVEGSLIFCETAETGYTENGTTYVYQPYNTSCLIRKNAFTKIMCSWKEISGWMIKANSKNTRCELNEFCRTYDVERDINNYAIVFSDEPIQAYFTTNYNANNCNFTAFKSNQPGFTVVYSTLARTKISYINFENGTTTLGVIAVLYADAKNPINISCCNFISIDEYKLREAVSSSCIYLNLGYLNIDNCVILRCSSGAFVAQQFSKGSTNYSMTITNCIIDQSQQSALSISAGHYILQNNIFDAKTIATHTLPGEAEIKTMYIKTFEGTQTYTRSPTLSALPSANNEFFSPSVTYVTVGTVAICAGIISCFFYIFNLYFNCGYKGKYFVFGEYNEDDDIKEETIYTMIYNKCCCHGDEEEDFTENPLIEGLLPDDDRPQSRKPVNAKRMSDSESGSYESAKRGKYAKMKTQEKAEKRFTKAKRLSSSSSSSD